MMERYKKPELKSFDEKEIGEVVGPIQCQYEEFHLYYEQEQYSQMQTNNPDTYKV